MKYVNYKSKGNTVGLENDINSFWELDLSSAVIRSVEMRADGSLIKYNESHDADTYGQLPEGPVTEENLNDKTYGSSIVITKEEFELMWSKTVLNWD